MRQRFSIGIDMGGTKTLAVLYSEREGVMDREVIPTDRYAPPEVSLSEIAVLVRRVANRAGLDLEDLAAVGVGVPGLVSPDRIFINSIILPTWISVDVGTWLSGKLNANVIVDNDATMAAMGHWLALRGHPMETLLCLTLGTGVGAAVIVNGKPVRGPDGTAGQLGHLTVNMFGRDCSCGSRGCLNAYVSGTAIAERYLEHIASSGIPSAITEKPVTAAMVSEAARNGNLSALEVIEETSLYLGAGLTSLVNIFNPDVVAITGGVSELGESLLAPARSVMRERAFPEPARRVKVECGRFGPETGAVGAAMCALE